MINYRILKLEMNGLFCERVFGLVNDWECYCGKYKCIWYKGIVCEWCGVEIIDLKVWCYRMGFIELVLFVIYVWYVKGRLSKIVLFLDIIVKELE